jgi:type I restriction enzyme S subunit
MTDWPVKTLGDVCEVIAGQSPEGKFYNKEGKGVPFYQGKKDFSERVLGSPTTWTTEVTKLSRPGDILMSVRAPVGPVNLCPIEACIGRGLAAIRPSSKTDTDFIFYYLESIQSEIAGTEGAVFASINKAQIADLRCPAPPLEEQKRIVALLDAVTDRVNELTACYEEARTHANNLHNSASREAFESNPDWPVKTIGDVCVVLDSLRKPITKRDRTSGDYPYYGATGIVDHVGDYIFDERLVLVGEDGAKWDAGDKTAFIAEGKYWVNNHAHVLRCKPGVLVDSWLANFLTMSDLNRYVSGLTVPKLNQGSLVSIAIPVPPLEEQERIVSRLDSMRLKTSEMVAAYDAKLQAAIDFRQSILDSAFSGAL